MTPADAIELIAECIAEGRLQERNIWRVIPPDEKENDRKTAREVLSLLRSFGSKPCKPTGIEAECRAMVKTVCGIAGLGHEEFLSKSRLCHLVAARVAWANLCWTQLGSVPSLMLLANISKYDHSTVSHWINSMNRNSRAAKIVEEYHKMKEHTYDDVSYSVSGDCTTV